MESSDSPNPQLQAQVTALAEELDEEYFHLQELEEDGDEKDPAALEAFSKARAAAAVAAALGEIPQTAAAETAYEAIAATNDLAHLTGITDKILAR